MPTTLTRLFPIVLLVSALASDAAAQSPGPAGHWEGTITAGDTQLRIELDLFKNGKGALAGTFGEPASGIKALPLAAVAVDGRTVRFTLKAGAAESSFSAVVSDDGQVMTGEVTQHGQSAPFRLTRTGEARTPVAPKNAAVSKELEGVWHGTVDADGRKMRLILTVRNQGDGTSVATVMSPDGSGMDIPVSVRQTGTEVRIEVAAVSATYSGVLDAAGTRLAGTWKQGPAALPLTFERPGR